MNIIQDIQKKDLYYYEYKIKKAIIIAKSPIASVKAKPKRVICIKRASLFGFLLKACNKPAKTIPIPAPAPTTPIVAKPAPIDLAAVVKLIKKIVFIKKN